MASETVDPIDWSHRPPSWAVPPESHVHRMNQCNLSWTRTYNRSMRGNHLAYAATQGIISRCVTDKIMDSASYLVAVGSIPAGARGMRSSSI